MDDQVEDTVVEEEIADDVTESEVDEVEAEEANDQDEEQEPGEGEEGDEEVEYEGKQYRVPKELKEALLRQADYTRKTQEVAESRKALEQQQQQIQQAAEVQQQNLREYAYLTALDSQIQQYQSVDWAKFSEDDPIEAQKAYFQYSQLKDQRQSIAENIKTKEQEAFQKRQVELATQVEQGRKQLAKEIPGWSEKLQEDLVAHGEEYGYSSSEMRGVVDPRAIRVLHDAYMYRKSLKAATSKPKADVKPVKAIRGKTSGRKDPGALSTEEYIRHREKELAARK